MKKYDYLIVGAGLTGSVIANELKQKGKKILVIDKRNHIGGDCYTENIEGINVHKYGAHIFRTNEKYVWDYINQFAEFNRFTNSPIANYKGELYNLPFNMNTFYAIYGTRTPSEAIAKIKEVTAPYIKDSYDNLEEKILAFVGPDIYQKLMKGYTEKQWGKETKDLPPSIINRLPLRFTFDNNYYRDKYQGIPVGGYTNIFEKMLDGVEVLLETDFFADREKFENIAEKIIFTGRIDEYYNCKLGKLGFRSLRFEHEMLDISDYQGNAVVNYTDYETPYTRIIEHKHFEFLNTEKTIISKEYPAEYVEGMIEHYPMSDKDNLELYEKYKKIAEKDKDRVVFCGRLGGYHYWDMQEIIIGALKTVKNL